MNAPTLRGYPKGCGKIVRKKLASAQGASIPCSRAVDRLEYDTWMHLDAVEGNEGHDSTMPSYLL